MSKQDYNKARATAERLITKFGAAGAVVIEGNDGGWDNATMQPIAATPDVTIDGIVTPVMPYSSREIDGSTILPTDGFAYFHADSIPPIGATHTQNGKPYRVQGVKTLTSVDGVNVYSKLQVRG